MQGEPGGEEDEITWASTLKRMRTTTGATRRIMWVGQSASSVPRTMLKTRIFSTQRSRIQLLQKIRKTMAWILPAGLDDHYIRRCAPSQHLLLWNSLQDRSSMLQHLSWSDHYSPEKEWNQPQFYFPTYKNDNLFIVQRMMTAKGANPVIVSRAGWLGCLILINQDEVQEVPHETFKPQTLIYMYIFYILK